MFATAIILVIGIGFIIWLKDRGNTQHDKMIAHIWDLENDYRKIGAGIDPSTNMAFNMDHSHDYHNANYPCPTCKETEDKNMALNKSAWAKYQTN